MSDVCRGSPRRNYSSPWLPYRPRRARIRARTAENSAPAPPTSASTTVGFSGESVHPVCARSGAATNSMKATPSITSAVFFIVTCFPKQNLNRNRQTLASTFPGIAQRGSAASASKPFPV